MQHGRGWLHEIRALQRRCIINPRAGGQMSEFEVGQLAEELHTGYMAYAALEVVSEHPVMAGVVDVLKSKNEGPAAVPIGSITRIDGSEIFYDLTHAIEVIGKSVSYRETYRRLWLSGALIMLGDALAAENYFDKAPDLELLRHLRNGVAHGNRFYLKNSEPRRPAHFRGADQTSLNGSTTPAGSGRFFQVTANCHGAAVLFDFMGPGDVVDLLMFIAVRLIRIGNGDPPFEIFPQ
jgi:hypothetical protein